MSKTISTFHFDVLDAEGLTFFNDGPTTHGVDHADVLPTVDKSSAAYREGYNSAMEAYGRLDAANAEADAEAAWKQSVSDLNAWRNEAPASAPMAPTMAPTPRRGDSSSVTAADAEAAWQESVNNLNAWRNEK